MIRRILAALLCAALPAPALAQTHVVAELGTAPLIGQVASTQQLQADVTKQRALFAAAGSELGLTPSEYAQFEQRISDRQLAYVTIPRHLDAMSWRSGGRVHVLHDVVIPAGTRGWEVDLREPGRIVALFVPNKCGNLSILRRPAPAIARAPQPVTATPAPIATLAPDAEPAVAVFAPKPAPALAPYTSVAASTGSAPAHHFRAWPLLLLVPIVALLAAHGHSTAVSSSPLMPAIPPAVPPPAPAPTPLPVVGCTPPPSN